MPKLNDGRFCEILLCALENARKNFELRVYGFVVMPEHVHLLLSEPARRTLADVMHAVKLSSAKRIRRFRITAGGDAPFWQKRYYDRNIRSYEDFAEKLGYIHRNPVKRGLCAKPGDWPWSSYRHYATGEAGVVEIESAWTARRRAAETREQNPG